MDEIKRIIKDISDRLEKFERSFTVKKLTIPSDGYFVLKVLTSDPVAPQVNEMWINSTTNQIKWNKSGTIKVVTLS